MGHRTAALSAMARRAPQPSVRSREAPRCKPPDWASYKSLPFERGTSLESEGSRRAHAAEPALACSTCGRANYIADGHSR